MAYRAPALVTLVLAAALAAGCAEQPSNGQPVVHRPLFESTYSHDLVSPREPPPFVIETVQERRGYVWAHSYSRWDGHDYVAVPGQWIPAKPDYRYVDATWERHRDGWHFKPGYWLPL
ncbi:YXWGXW repeat-containing protein [Rhodanobacter sp. MP1X3]|uniref:YXWGXW repeat-containing protein n=1 Tax=Rhodanobacter sp. MP1X3 TaxID=2723086 RepID=UPI00161E783D|nr:YXWGXW repeat-containing protein [Rhodanobacter sp. MP1X3]MBB6241989.1 hypothetical protein [Rhodanobacter sp. MP1X3]